MKLVFEKFERSLTFTRGKVSVLCVSPPLLFARCAYSLIQNYASDVLGPATFFDDENKELKTLETLFVVGDVLTFDLNDKKILNIAMKELIKRMGEDGTATDLLEEINLQIEEVFNRQLWQMEGSYTFAQGWDEGKYLRMSGFSVDEADDVTPFDKACHILRVASDLFPQRVLAFVNLCTMLTEEQFQMFCEAVASEQLIVMLCETDGKIDFRHLDNRLLIDENYLEY